MKLFWYFGMYSKFNLKNNDNLINFYSFSTIKVWLKWKGMYHEIDLWACRVAGSSIQWSTWKSSGGPILVSWQKFRSCYTLHKFSIIWYKIESMLKKIIFKPRLDYGFSTTDRLYDYVSARAYGEHEVT